VDTEPAQIVALAAELEKEGQYNAAKLLRATATGLLTREAVSRIVPTDPQTQAAALEMLASQLRGTVAEPLVSAFQSSAAAIREGRVALPSEAPDPFVCRLCGNVRTEAFETRCGYCGRWPSTAERIRPIYWMRASTPPEAIELLRKNAQQAARIIEDASATDRPGPDGGWTAHQTLEHLHNAQVVFRDRIDQLLAGGDPELRSVMVWKMSGVPGGTEKLLGDYLELRDEVVGLLESARPEAFWNRGTHEEWGSVTLGEQLSYFANHEPTHLSQLADAT